MAKEKKKICVIILRLMAMFAILVAAIVMATSREDSTIFGFEIHARYYYEPAFRFFVVANAVGAVYSFLVLFLPQKSMTCRLVVALDVVITMLLTSSMAAAGAIAYVGKKGNSHAGWLPTCGQFHKFCDQVMVAMILAFAGLLIYMSLLLYAIHTVVNPLL